MTRRRWRLAAALLWLLIVTTAGVMLLVKTAAGLTFQSDLMALVPREERNPALAAASDKVYATLSRQVVVLVGAADRRDARQAARLIGERMRRSGLLTLATGGLTSDRLKAIGAAYYPYRAGLLAARDRQMLKAGRGEELAQQALAQIYGLGGMTGSSQVRSDPFLLFPRYIGDLPMPTTNLTLDDGMLSLTAEGKTWVMVAGTLTGEPYGLDVQKRFVATLDEAVTQARRTTPALETLKTGAVFFAKAGAETAMAETSRIGTISILFTVLLLVFAFRSLGPLWQSLLVIGVGLTAAMAVSLLVWGEMHVIALLFGVSLIGVTVDYALQYCSEIYVPHDGGAFARLKAVFAGISLGAATTVVGYAALLLAPLPGLKQIALFSVVGLVAAWTTVVLWLPILDRRRAPARTLPLAGSLQRLLAFWEAPEGRRGRRIALAALAVAALVGAFRLQADDDVRKLQSLSPPLVAEQQKIQRLIGALSANQFFVIQAPNEEAALQAEETLTTRLAPRIADGTLAGVQTVAGFVPSLKRQAENRRLVVERLYRPQLTAFAAALGMTPPPLQPSSTGSGLTPQAWTADGGASSLALLRLGTVNGSVVHVATLSGVKVPDTLAAATQGVPYVRFVNPTQDYSQLFGKYRVRAVVLLALSAGLMLLLLIGRYRLRRGLAVLAPPVLAVTATPFLAALGGEPFTFFSAIALVLVLSMGLDYAVFFAETGGMRKTTTLFAILISAATTMASFGALAFSSVSAVHGFGLTMLIGVALSFLLAPMVQWGRHAR